MLSPLAFKQITLHHLLCEFLYIYFFQSHAKNNYNNEAKCFIYERVKRRHIDDNHIMNRKSRKILFNKDDTMLTFYRHKSNTLTHIYNIIFLILLFIYTSTKKKIFVVKVSIRKMF